MIAVRKMAPPARVWAPVGLALAAWLAAGTARAADPAFNTEATVVFYDAAGNETLDPAHPQTSSSFSQEVPMAVYDTLVRLNAVGDVKPGLAQSWSYNADLTEFTLKLRPNVSFHDGTKLTADAVKRNFERDIALGSRASAPMVDSFRSVAAIETVGDDTVRLKLKEPNGQMEFLLAFVAGMIASPAAFENDAYGASFKPIGAGPYMVKSFDSNVKTTLARFDKFWEGTDGRPAAFEHHYVPDGRARLNALRSGQANVALIEPRQIAEAKGAGLAVKINEKNSAWTIYINLSRATTGDLRVRKAFMHAIDREMLADALSFGSSKPTAQIFSSASPVYDASLDALYPFDQAKAKALLAEAGYKDGVDVTMLLLNTTEYKQLAEALQAMLGEVGIRLKFDTVDASQFTLFRRPPPRGDIMQARWGGRPDPLQAFAELAGTGGAYNPVGVASPEIDTLIAKARGMAASDPARLDVLRQINRATVENVSTFTIMTRSNVYAFKPGCVAGLDSYLPFGDDKFNNVKIEAKCK
jgi:peptide/nickel transport system substrate-binding protein